MELKVRPFIDVNIKADEETAKRELKRLSTKIPEEAFVRLDIRWERPYDVSKLTELIKARYVYVRTRFERKLTGRTPLRRSSKARGVLHSRRAEGDKPHGRKDHRVY